MRKTSLIAMKWPYWAGALLLYAAFLIATAPASLLFWAANSYFSPYAITAESSEGTLVAGGAQGIVLTARNQPVLQLGQASWSLNPLWLLAGKLSADLMLAGDGVKGHGKLILGPHSLRFQQASLSVPAALLSYVEPRLDMWPLKGILNIRSNEFLLQPDHYQGDGEITWEQAGTTLVEINPIGSYHATFSGTGKAIHIQVETQAGALELSGKGDWSQAAGFEFDGSAKAREHEAELRHLLDL
ncbi:MAG: type II secretion system protein N, partial [Sulfurimicrobium sp.]